MTVNPEILFTGLTQDGVTQTLVDMGDYTGISKILVKDGILANTGLVAVRWEFKLGAVVVERGELAPSSLEVVHLDLLLLTTESHVLSLITYHPYPMTVMPFLHLSGLTNVTP